MGGDLHLLAEDLSVAIDDEPGGMRLRAELGQAGRLPAAGAEVVANFHLPGETTPLPGHIRLMRTGAGINHVWLGVKYRLNSQRDEEKVQRLWVRYQRQMRKG